MSISLSDLPPKAREQVITKLAIEESRRRNRSQAPAADVLPTPPLEPKGNKFHAKKAVRVLPNGEEHVFDSQREARRYDELALMLKAGKIRNLRLQPQYTLQESYITSDGERVRAIRYVADFSYELQCEALIAPEGGADWILKVEDVKSRATATAQYRMKRKMMQEKYGIAVQEV